MSWYYPTEEEAADAYIYYQNRYYNAADERNASIRQEQSYISQKSVVTTYMNDLSAQKINFEKRLEGIIKIINMLEGNVGYFGTNVPSAIAKATSTIQKADSSYRSSIKMTGGISAASLEEAFSIKTVEGDPRSFAALEAYKGERIKLEEGIEDLKNQLATLSSQITTLSSQISACRADQVSLRNIMNSSAYEMNHYKKYMY